MATPTKAVPVAPGTPAATDAVRPVLPDDKAPPTSTTPTITDNDNNNNNNNNAPKSPSPTTPANVPPSSDIPTVTKEPYVFRPTRRFWLAYLALCMLILVVALDATTLSVALPHMSSELDGTAIEAFWSGTSFLLASCVLQPSIAAASGVFGRKHAIYGSVFFFAVGSIVAAVANDFTVILVGRTLQGIGGGGIIAMTEVVITDLVPLAKRGVWFSGLSMAWAVGTIAGPLLGAAFAQRVTWRWIFWINVPIVAVAVAPVFLFLHQEPLPGGTMHKLGQIDWTGSFLFTAGSTILLFGITVGGVMYDWDSVGTLLPIVLGLAVIGVFAYWELRFAKQPMIERGIFNNWTMIAGYILAVFHGMILWSLLYFLTLYYQGIKLMDPINAGLAMLPETLTVAPAAGLVGAVAAVTGRYRWSLWAGWVLTTLGTGVLYLLDLDTTTGQWIGLNISVGLGTGMLFPGTALTIQAACEPALNAHAAAFFSFVRVFGQSIGVATSGVIFQNAFRDKLLDTGAPDLVAAADAYSHDAAALPSVIQAMPPSEGRVALMRAYNDGLRVIWISLTAFAGFGLLVSLTVKGYTLNQEHVTKHGFVEGGEKRRSVVPVSDEERGKEGVLL